MSPRLAGQQHCSFCTREGVRLAAGAEATICEDCAQSVIRQFSQPPSFLQYRAVSDVENALRTTLALPTLFEPARKLARVLASPLNLPPSLLGHRGGGANHVLLVGPTGSGKTRLAMALRKVAPTAVVDAAQITSAGHDGMPLSTTVRALLREAAGIKEHARFGIVVLDNLDCWLAEPTDLHRRNLWWELLMYLEGCDVSLAGKTVLATDNMTFVGLLRDKSNPPKQEQTSCLLKLGIPEQVLARMHLKLFLAEPDAVSILALMEKSAYPVFEQYNITRSARELLASRAAGLGLGAWGLRHVISELDLLIGQEAKEPRRIDRRYLERRLGPAT